MNQKQKTVLLCAASILGIMLLFPPYTVKNSAVLLKSGYGFLFALPTHLQNTTELAATVNVPTFLIQIFVVLAAGGMVYLALKEE